MLLLALLISVIGCGSAFSQNFKLTLKDDFIESYYNKATITANFVIDHTHHHAKDIGSSASDDGDIHAAARSGSVGLASVIEIMNARLTQNATDIFIQQEGKTGANDSIAVSGVWRVWFEHPGKKGAHHKQGNKVYKAKNTNPDHVFEVHPITKVGSIDVRHTFIPIKDGNKEFGYKKANTAFEKLNKAVFKVSKPNAATTTLHSSMVGYNYILFSALITSEVEELSDGHAVVADLYHGNSKVASDIRLVFVAGTPPDVIFNQTLPTQKIKLVGIPRVSLDVVREIVEYEELPYTTTLPYEVVIVSLK